MSDQTLPRILLVDDDPLLLDALRRQLGRTFSVTTAVGPTEGLALLEREPRFQVVLSDYQMPVMNGAAFLAAVRGIAPDVTRMLLTGQADLGGAAAVVNEGGVFRFLLKPVPTPTLVAALEAGVGQHQLVIAERELLEQTLQGSVRALTEILSLASPSAFARASRLRRLADTLFEAMGEPVPWHVGLAVMLSQVGAVALPPEVLRRVESRAALSADEQAMLDRLPAIAEQVLAGIPRLDEVRAAIRCQSLPYAGAPDGPGSPSGVRLPLGARVLRLVQDYDALEGAGSPAADVLRVMRQRPGMYDPGLLEALGSCLPGFEEAQPIAVAVADLLCGHVLAEDVYAKSGAKLLRRGQEITPSMLELLRNFSLSSPIQEPVLVLEHRGSAAVAR